MRKAISIFSLGAALFIASLLQGTIASADIFIFNQPNPDLAVFAGPYGQVEIDFTSSTTATVTATSFLTPTSGYTPGFAFVDGGTLGLNFNQAVTVGSPPPGNAPFPAGTGLQAGSTVCAGCSVNGFGTFSLVIDQLGNNPNLSFSFTVTGTSSLSLVNNSDGFFAAAHFLALGSQSICGGGTPCNGFATVATATVPESASLLFLGAGWAGIGVWQWKNRKLMPLSSLLRRKLMTG
jgi:hypothetical protein